MRDAEIEIPNRDYSAHLNPEGRYTREKTFFPQISQKDADLKNIIQVCFNR
jgi:hypothetical protein